MLLLLSSLTWAQGLGEVFVKTEVRGARILLDGEDTGLTTPGVLEGVSAGTHEIKVLTDDCRMGLTDVVVAADDIQRVELTLVDTGAVLQVNSLPVGATVAIDGAIVATTPLASQPLACGEHTVEVYLEGYQNAQETVLAVADGELQVNLLLDPVDQGALQVQVTPETARVRVDDRPAGIGPVTLLEMSSGQHVVSATADGYVEGSVTVTVEEGETAVAVLELEPDSRIVQLPERQPRTPRTRSAQPGLWKPLALSGGLLLGAAGTAGLSLQQYRLAQSNYEIYSGLTYLDEPEAFYASDVLRHRRISTGLWISSAVLGVAGLGLPLVIGVQGTVEEPLATVTVEF
jgi:hypothetical protein